MPKIVNRARQSQWEAIPMECALQKVRDIAQLFEPQTKQEQVHLLTGDQILAESIHAKENVPKSRTSIKDGYAIISTDGVGIRSVIGVSVAGAPFKNTLKSGECVRVNTGSVVPDDADAVIQVEDTELVKYDEDKDVELEICIKEASRVGQDIRQPGSEISIGDLLLDKGCILRSAEVGLLNAMGIKSVLVYKRARVAIMSTGNELIDNNKSNNTEIPEGFIRDSNRPQLFLAFNEHGFRSIDNGICIDEPDKIEQSIIQAAKFAQVIVTTGGVSMGEKDHLKYVLQEKLNFTIEFGRVFMKPGLPCTVAQGTIHNKRIVIFALPGNPASAWVCAQLFTVPLLRIMAGHKNGDHTVIKVKVSNVISLGPRPEYCRAYLETNENDNHPTAIVTGNQLSARHLSIVGVQLLLILPPKTAEKQKIEQGELVNAIIIRKL